MVLTAVPFTCKPTCLSYNTVHRSQTYVTPVKAYSELCATQATIITLLSNVWFIINGLLNPKKKILSINLNLNPNRRRFSGVRPLFSIVTMAFEHIPYISEPDIGVSTQPDARCHFILYTYTPSFQSVCVLR